MVRFHPHTKQGAFVFLVFGARFSRIIRLEHSRFFSCLHSKEQTRLLSYGVVNRFEQMVQDRVKRLFGLFDFMCYNSMLYTDNIMLFTVKVNRLYRLA